MIFTVAVVSDACRFCSKALIVTSSKSVEVSVVSSWPKAGNKEYMNTKKMKSLFKVTEL